MAAAALAVAAPAFADSLLPAAEYANKQLPDPRHFGRDLGLFNLTNTLPSLISPLLAALVIGQFGYQALLGILAAMMLLPALLLGTSTIR